MTTVLVTGAINWDINLFVKRFPKGGEEVAVEKIARVPGGKAGNVAVAAARLLGPGSVSIAGALGNDAIGREQIRIFKEEGIDTSGIIAFDDAESGQAYIAIDERGENIIYTHFGANALLKPENVRDGQIRKILEECQIVCIMDPPHRTAETISAIAKEHNKLIAWDLGVWSELGTDILHNLIVNADYLAMNESELWKFLRTQDSGTAWKQLSTINDRVILILKKGDKGCVLITKNRTIELPALRLESLGMKVVSTVGCGDAFLGAFIASKARGSDDERALLRANTAAGLKATRSETRGSPTLIELERFLP